MIPDGAMVFAEPPQRPRVGGSRRDTCQAPRSRKLTLDQQAAIQANAANRTLRELAAEFEVSHETVRAVLRGQSAGPS